MINSIEIDKFIVSVGVGHTFTGRINRERQKLLFGKWLGAYEFHMAMGLIEIEILPEKWVTILQYNLEKRIWE